MSASESRSAVVMGLAEEFLERYRQGQRPSLKEYIDRHPELAGEIKEVFPAMALMENIALDDESLIGAATGPHTVSGTAPPEQLGDYRVLREVGRGGMGIVYEAEQVSLGRHVALKVLPRKVLLDDAHKRRFEREAKAAAKLHHTNIVPVFGVGEHDGLPYYVMQFIQGLGLDDVLDELKRMQGSGTPTATGGELRVSRKDVSAADVARSLLTGAFQDGEPAASAAGLGTHHPAANAAGSPESSGKLSDSYTVSSAVKLPGSDGAAQTKGRKATYWQSVAQIGVQVAEALEYAHKQGIQHRDIKPSNLLLDTAGTVWVTDFGLARADNEDHLTATGDIVGTLRYMPPEAFEGRADKRGDIYSLGLTLYELVAFQPAYEERDRHRLIKRVTTEEPSRLDKSERSIPRDLVTIVHKAIDREPGRRYQTAGELAADLQRFVEDRPVRARRVSDAEKLWRWCRRNPLPASLLAGILLVFLAGFAGVFWQWREAATARDRAELSHKETADALGVVESQKAAVEGSLTKAERAEQVARAAEEAGRKLLYTTDMQLAPFVWKDDRTTTVQLRILLAKHIPDSNAAVAKPDLRGFEWHYYQHLLEHSAAVFSGHDVSVTGGAFTANGQLVTLDQKGQVRRWDLGAEEEDKASRHDLPGGARARVRVLSPNGRLAALALGKKVHVFDTATGKETFQIDSANVRDRHLIFSRDRERLVIVDNKIRWVSAASGEVIASVDQKFNRVNSLALSADGRTLAVVGYGNLAFQFSIFRLDATAKKATSLAKGGFSGGSLHASAMTPDGRRIAVGAKLSGSLFVFDAATGRPIALQGSAHASPIAAMAFSGDSAKLATADAEGTIKIWADAQKLNSKSTAFLTLKGHQGAITSIDFSSDGKRLVTTSLDKTARVWDLENAGAAIRPLERSGLSSVARFSPDGQLIAAAGGRSVHLWDAATGRLVRELSAGDTKGSIYSVAFSPTDSRLLAVGYGGQADISYVELWDIDAGTELARLPGATDLPGFPADANFRVVSALAFSPDGKYLAAGFGSKYYFTSESSPKPVKVWEVATRRLIRRLNGHTNFCVSLDFSRDGKLLASGSRDGTAILWSTATWNNVQTLQNPDKDSFGQSRRGMVEAVAFSPDGKTLALASREGNVQLWDLATGKLLETLKGHSSAVRAVVFSPDGRTLASGSSDETVRLWNVQTRRQLMQLDPGSVKLGLVYTLAFSPDGRHLLAGGPGSAAFWSAAPIVWNDPDRAAEKLRLLLRSNADPVGQASQSVPDGPGSPSYFQSRIRMLSENLRLHEALAKLDAKDVRVQAALAATRANWHASQQHWALAVREVDRLLAADPSRPEAWLRTPGLLRLAMALVHQNRPAVAAMLLQGGAKLGTQDPAMFRGTGFGFNFDLEDGAVRLRAVFAGSPAARGNLLPGDVVVKVNGLDTANSTMLDALKMLAGGDIGSKARLTIRHPGKAETEDVDLVKANHLLDEATAKLFSQLRAALEERLTQAPKDAGLLELRAELAGQESDFARQAADYTAAIQILAAQPAKTAAADLRRLYRRRGDAYIGLKQWQKATDDYARIVTDKTKDEALLSNQALALANSYFEQESPTTWTVLKPAEMKSQGGATLTLLEDGSVLASGPNPVHDSYTLVCPTSLPKIAAVRLEALPDPSLPHNGSGRATENGNIALSEFKVTVEPQKPGETPRVIRWKDAWSEHRLEAAEHYKKRPMHIGLAIDGDSTTYWETWPKSRSPHSAIFLPDEPIGPGEGRKLKFILDFPAEPRGHNLGRFRLSISGKPPALEREEKRFAVLKISDPRLRLAAAYALNGRNDEALPYFRRALQQAGGYEARKPILEAAAHFDEVVAALSKQQPDDPQLQLALARNLAQRGKQRLAEKQPAKAQADLEKSREILTQRREGPKWTVLTPIELKSQEGEALTVEKDGSIFVSGPNPERAVYTLKMRTDLPTLTAIRLETVPDVRLPDGGAGRYDGDRRGSGNFHLAELTASFVSSKEEGKTTPIDFSSAMADEQQMQRGYDPSTILDGNPRTYWDTYPRMKQPHWVILALKTPLRTDGGYLRITLDSGISQWNKHGLGRFRLSATNAIDALVRTRLRNDLKDSEVVDLNVALAKAHAQQGRLNEAVILFAAALDPAGDRAAKARIITQAASLEGVLEKLAERAAGDAPFQAALARHFAARGNAKAADAARAKARALFERQRTARPDDVTLASGLADLLWSALPPVEHIWIDDAAPPGAKLQVGVWTAGKYELDNTPWEFVSRPEHPVFRGKKSSRRQAQGVSQHFFEGAAPGLKIGEDTKLFAYVYLDPKDPPKAVMLQFKDGASWEHRVFWGEDLMPWGSPGTANRLPMGPLPRAGKWVRLEVEAVRVGLPAGAVLDGLAFTQHGGTCYWDAAGCTNSFETPWQKLAVAYHRLGDQQAFDMLIAHHPEAASCVGDLYAASGDWERALAEYRKLITEQRPDIALLTKLATAYESAGRSREGVPYLAKASAANPKDTALSQKVAALQAWFGQDKELAATRKRILAFAKETKEWNTADRAAKACSILPSTDKGELEAALALARKEVELARGEWALMTLGMTEYRCGNDAAADQAMLAAAKAGPNNSYVTSLAAFYRAMSLFRQGKKDEARKLSIAAAAKMKPLPKDENNPLAGDANHDDLILWLAYKEAKALIQFDAAPVPKTEKDKK